MKQFEHAGRTWSFDPLPANETTAKFFLGLATLAKQARGKKDGKVTIDMDVAMEVAGVLPRCIARSMRDHHTPEEIEQFQDSVPFLDMSNEESMKIYSKLQLLFMGVDPATATLSAEAGDADTGQ